MQEIKRKLYDGESKLRELNDKQFQLSNEIRKIKYEIRNAKKEIHDYNEILRKENFKRKIKELKIDFPENVTMPTNLYIYKSDKLNDYDKCIIEYDNVRIIQCIHSLQMPLIYFNDQLITKNDTTIDDDVYFETEDEDDEDSEDEYDPNQSYYEQAKMHDIEVVIDNFRNLLKDKWFDELEFGIVMLYYLVKVYLNGGLKQQMYKNIYNIFESVYEIKEFEDENDDSYNIYGNRRGMWF